MGTTSPALTSTDLALAQLRYSLMAALADPSEKHVRIAAEAFEDLDVSLRDGQAIPAAWRPFGGR